MKFHVSQEPLSVSIMAMPTSGGWPPGVCSASVHVREGEWFLNRLKVRDECQGQGVGPQLLAQLKAALVERAESHPDWPQCDRLIVTPGGYGSDEARLWKFYEREGFEPLEDYLVWTRPGV